MAAGTPILRLFLQNRRRPSFYSTLRLAEEVIDPKRKREYIEKCRRFIEDDELDKSQHTKISRTKSCLKNLGFGGSEVDGTAVMEGGQATVGIPYITLSSTFTRIAYPADKPSNCVPRYSPPYLNTPISSPPLRGDSGGSLLAPVEEVSWTVIILAPSLKSSPSLDVRRIN